MERSIEFVSELFTIFIAIAFTLSAMVAMVALGYVVVVLCVGGYRMIRSRRTDDVGGKTRDDEES